MTKQTEALKLALENICAAKLCEFNSMSSRHEMIRLMDAAITALREALAEQPAQQEPVDLEAVYETIIHWDEGGGKRSRRELARRIVALAEQPAQQEPVAWQRIETAPKTGRKVILFYLNRNNFPRTVMARWLTDDEAAETDTDCVGLEGGWYECIDNWDDYTEVAIHEGEPTHWMPLPPAPIVEGKPDAA